jgi:hypothetical protein
MQPPRHPGAPVWPPRTLSGALAASESLAGLLQRVTESRQRFEVVAALLPAPLREAVRPGPLDEKAWALLAANAAAAAKLRQMLPALQAALQAHGWGSPVIQVKIAPRSTQRHS